MVGLFFSPPAPELLIYGAPGQIRTAGLLVRSQRLRSLAGYFSTVLLCIRGPCDTYSGAKVAGKVAGWQSTEWKRSASSKNARNPIRLQAGSPRSRMYCENYRRAQQWRLTTAEHVGEHPRRIGTSSWRPRTLYLNNQHIVRGIIVRNHKVVRDKAGRGRAEAHRYVGALARPHDDRLRR